MLIRWRVVNMHTKKHLAYWGYNIEFPRTICRRPWAHEELSPRFTFSLKKRHPNHRRNKTSRTKCLPRNFPEGVEFWIFFTWKNRLISGKMETRQWWRFLFSLPTKTDQKLPWFTTQGWVGLIQHMVDWWFGARWLWKGLLLRGTPIRLPNH